jgi:hypothetical protein
MPLTFIVIVFCGLLIGLALFLLIRSLRRMIKGRCCEGCDGCSQASNCSSFDGQTKPNRAGKE